MRVPFGDLSREYRSLKPKIDRAVSRVLQSGRFILGRELEFFEKSFARHLGMPEAVGVASGTEAIALALRALGVGTGDEVITVSYTAPPTALAISMIGAVPKFVDIREENCLMDTERIKKAINSRTKAILPVHMYGQCVDMDPVLRLAKKHGLGVVEDCAHAHGAA